MQGENGRILATEHHYMEDDHIQPWLEGIDGSRIGRVQQNVKYKYGVTELKMKDAQMNGKRTNRILKESTYEAQNFTDNNDIGEEANGEHKTDSKTDNGRNVNNLVMLDYDMSGSGHPSETLDNVPEFVTEHQGKSLRNSSEGGGHPYDMGQTKTMSSGVMNDAFLQRKVMKNCNDKRKRWARDWQCPTQKDVCIPDRRFQLCMMELTNLENNKDKNSDNDIKIRKLDLKNKLIHDATVEGDLLLKKNNYRYNKVFCKDIRWSLEDFGDIIMGTDMEGIGYSKVVEDNLSSIFGTDEKGRMDRKQWWNESKEEIWKALMSSVKTRWDNKFGLKEKFVWICEENVVTDVEAQIYRWIREWGMDYVSELSAEQKKLKENCDGKMNDNGKKVCTVSACQNSCKLYDKWITKKKTQWDILSNKFISVKKEQNIQTADIAAPYDILKQELNEFNEVAFQNEINKRDNVYIDLCVCAVKEVSRNAQEIVEKVEKSPTSNSPNLESTTQSANNSKEDQVRGDTTHGIVNSGADSSTTGKAATGDGQNENHTPAEDHVQRSDIAQNAPGENVDAHKSVTAGGADTTSTTDIANNGKENLDTSGSRPSESTVKENSSDESTVNSLSVPKENSEQPLVTTHNGLGPSEDNNDNNKSTESHAPNANPKIGTVDSSKDSAHGIVNTAEDSSTISAATPGNGGSADVKPVEDPATTENGGAHGDTAQGSLPSPSNDPSVLAGQKGNSDVRKEESEKSKANLDGESVHITEQGTPTITETQPEQSDIADPGVVGVTGSDKTEGATPLSGTKSLETNESVYKTTNDTTDSVENTNGGSERGFQKHDFNNSNMPNGGPNSNQTARVDEHHRGSIRQDEAERRGHMYQDNSMENPNRYQLYSHNNLSNDKLNIDEYQHRDVNATREEIIRMSKAHKCNNNVSLKYCNSIEDRMSSSTCSKEERGNLCCSISDFCLNYFEVYSYDYHNCMKKEFEDPSYKCFTKGSFTNKAYFAAGGAFLILLLLMAARNMNDYDPEEEASFNDFEEYSDNIHRIPLIPDDIEHIQTSTPLDYS
ncbi:Duffy-binding protein 1 [Plasmodium coatneyi]|uniref:Duffy-binding protein 1 n=1 Tax=Plasmodium coatneyi TaxID=208452 RepID=A0A1B1E5Y5_9APIC|nr:Duffy-binding protein 1 [Plasmodium coatneyi]ANQ10421.1 Duffy-binding protein 1 [Plasmodium coatneyi]